jgi:Fe-S-cluster containining protein
MEAVWIALHATALRKHMTSAKVSRWKWFSEVQFTRRPYHGYEINVGLSPVVKDGVSRCVFQRKDTRCAIQVFDGMQGTHKWTHKPLYCWLFPLSIAKDRHDPSMTFISVDESWYMETCNRQGPPIVIGMREELEYLMGERAYKQLLHMYHVFRQTKKDHR